MSNDNRTARQTSGAKWEKTRKVIFRRDKYLCQVCAQKNETKVASEVDHIKPLWTGGTDELVNLQAICSECHKIKTAREQGHVIKSGCNADGIPISEYHPWHDDKQ